MAGHRLFSVTIEGFGKEGPWVWSHYVVAESVVRACAFADLKAEELGTPENNVRVSDVRLLGDVFIDQSKEE